MGNIYVNDCADGEVGQQWNVMADGRIALSASSPRKLFRATPPTFSVNMEC